MNKHVNKRKTAVLYVLKNKNKIIIKKGKHNIYRYEKEKNQQILNKGNCKRQT